MNEKQFYSSDDSLNDQETLGHNRATPTSLFQLEPFEDSGKNPRYQVIRQLGIGGMGEVLLAKDQVLGRHVAMKRVTCQLTTAANQRFVREAQTIAKLSHPNIVQIFDIRQSDAGPMIIMEFVEGSSLREYLKQKGKLSIEASLAILRNVVDALAAAHLAGIIHRDIKPANILLTPDGIAKLGDFGLAGKQDDHSLTTSGGVFGTPLYIAPEQARDARNADGRSDLYSLGLTLYEMLTARSPRQLRLEDLPEGIRPVVARMTDEEPTARFQSCRELLCALDETRKLDERQRKEAAAMRSVSALAAAGNLNHALALAHQLLTASDPRIAEWATNACAAIQERIAASSPLPPKEIRKPPSSTPPLETKGNVDISLDDWHGSTENKVFGWLRKWTKDV